MCTIIIDRCLRRMLTSRGCVLTLRQWQKLLKNLIEEQMQKLRNSRVKPREFMQHQRQSWKKKSVPLRGSYKK